jgi:hypothetical protein
MPLESIYVLLPRETVPVWAPVGAEQMGDSVYRILDCGCHTHGQFGKGALVRCRHQILAGIDRLVAYESFQTRTGSSTA